MNIKDLYKANGAESELGMIWEPEEEEEVGRSRARFMRVPQPRRIVSRIKRPVRQPRRPVPRRRRRRLPINPGMPFVPAAQSQGSEYVRWVQTMLNQLLNLRLPIHGMLDVQTRSAVRSFQEKNGLPVTGIVGPDTERALMGAKDGQSPGTSKPGEPAAAEPSQPAAPSPEPEPAAPAEPAPSSPAAEFEWESNETWRNVTSPFFQEPEDTLEQFIGKEHRDIGDEASGKVLTAIRYGERGERLTFGAVVMLAGDVFESYQEMRDLAETVSGRAKIAWARWDALDLNGKEPEPQLDKDPRLHNKIKKSITERNLLLASRNWSHFSFGGAGGAWNTYAKWHFDAILSAFQAGHEANKNVWQIALTKDAFGAHFLTDMFSSGHVRIPRLSMLDWYEKHFRPDSLLRYMAKFLATNTPLAWHKSILASIFPGKALNTARSTILDVGGTAAKTVSVGDIVSVTLHDYDSEHGLHVVSDVNGDGKKIAGGFKWCAVGDEQLAIFLDDAKLKQYEKKHLDDLKRRNRLNDLERKKLADKIAKKKACALQTKQMVIAAVKASLRELRRVREAGQKLAGQRLSSEQKIAAIGKALGAVDRTAISKAFTARAFIPREDHTARANISLPGPTKGKSPLEWRWGQLGTLTYSLVDNAVKGNIATRLSNLVDKVDDKRNREGLRRFVKHLETVGIHALENAVGKKAR